MSKVAEEYQYYQNSNLMIELAAAAHQESYVGQTSSATFSEISSRIAQMGLKPGSYILDAGCGNGAFSRLISKKFSINVEGIDVSNKLVLEATKLAEQEKLEKKCRFICNDFTDPSSYERDLYDGIICIGSLYWGYSLTSILNLWKKKISKEDQLLLFLNLSSSPLDIEQKRAIGETKFIDAFFLKEELLTNGWEIIEWSDVTPTYIDWLQRWNQKVSELLINIQNEMGVENATRLVQRFSTYLDLALMGTVKRIILRAKYV